MKNHSAPIQPTMDMDQAATTLNLQTDLRVKELNCIIAGDFNLTDKRWSSLASAPKTTSFGEGTALTVSKQSLNLSVLRVGLRVFCVFDDNEGSTIHDETLSEDTDRAYKSIFEEAVVCRMR